MDMRESKASKSARKREHLALQDLGEALIGLGPSELESLPLDERLREAVVAARGMHAHGALRRQRQLIGKLMKNADAAAIRASLERLAAGDRQANRVFHAAESWRDRVCAEGAPAVAEFAAATGAEARILHQLAGELVASRDEKQRRNIGRKIFREVHAILSRSPDAAAR